MIIVSVEEVSPDCLKVIDETASFLMRPSYLTLVPANRIVSGAEFDGDAENDIKNAISDYSVERKALDYIARSEQSRRGLFIKLTAKGFDRMCIEKALDYLEKRSYLSDARFASAWLSSRRINHNEGRLRLASELTARGIARNIIDCALDDFFTVNSEYAICCRAREKCLRLKKNDKKTRAYLVSHGFSANVIERCLSTRAEASEN